MSGSTFSQACSCSCCGQSFEWRSQKAAFRMMAGSIASRSLSRSSPCEPYHSEAQKLANIARDPNPAPEIDGMRQASSGAFSDWHEPKEGCRW